MIEGQFKASLSIRTSSSRWETGDFLDIQQIEDLTRDLTARMKSMQHAEQNLDAPALLEHFSEEPDFCLYSDGQRIDFVTLAEGITATYDEVKSITGSIGRMEVRILSPQHGLVSAEFREVVVTAEDRESSSTGVATWLWQRNGTTWKIVYGQIGHEDENQMTLSASLE